MLRNLLILNLCISCTFYFLTIWFFRLVGLFCNYFLKISHFGNSFIWILFYPLVGWLKFWNWLSLLRGNILLLCKGAVEGWGFFIIWYLKILHCKRSPSFQKGGQIEKIHNLNCGFSILKYILFLWFLFSFFFFFSFFLLCFSCFLFFFLISWIEIFINSSFYSKVLSSILSV